jgi:hypothetical protein
MTLIDAHSPRPTTASSLAEQYANPDVAAAKLLNPTRYPLVAVEVRTAMPRKELAAERKADDILRYIHNATFFSPADYFDPGGKGGWLISQEAYRELPPEIRCLIEEVELRTVETESGTTHKLWVRFVSKAQAMALAAKHQLGEKIHATVTQVASWDDFALQIGLPDLVIGGAKVDVIDRLDQGQGKLEGLGMPASEPTPETAPPVNRLGCTPSRNGNGAGHR